jgi:hypothetical protein
MVAWVAFKDADFALTQGEPVTFNSTGKTMRSFCGRCGTGLFYRNADFFPGTVDIQSATLDEPERVPPESQMQVAERLGWMTTAHELPVFDRFP